MIWTEKDTRPSLDDAGATHVSSVELTMVAATVSPPPNTHAALSPPPDEPKASPVTVTMAPPSMEPVAGCREVTEGAAE